ncbi:MAG TPA: ATP-binding protein [Saprospiraceae bacterium]|nr:ATP-binding protein [Saprospiraceae bacterium]
MKSPKNISIQKKLLKFILMISGIILFVTCIAFSVCEYYTFRSTTLLNLSTIGKVIAANSTAALAFDNNLDAEEILTALKAESHVIAACLYDKDGNLFSQYTSGSSVHPFPEKPEEDGYRFEHFYVIGFEPVILGNNRLGTLYMKSDLKAMFARFKIWGIILISVLLGGFALAYFLSGILQKSISRPILALAETVKEISNVMDYSMRAKRSDNDELGLLTTAFNQMLTQIQEQNLEIKSFNHMLEQKVIERTLELTDSLEREQEMNEMKSRFVSMASHEFRTPLTAILSSISLIEMYGTDQEDVKKGKQIERIKSSVKNLTHILNDFLSLEKMEHGKVEIENEKFDLNEFSKDIIEELKGMLKQGQSINFSGGGVMDLFQDKTILKNVLLNLLSNAIKYSEVDKEINLLASVSNNLVSIIVRDQGIGIPAGEQKNMFGKFFRAKNVSHIEGTGLGLNIVKKYIELLDGTICFESKHKQGTSFTVEFPQNSKYENNIAY